MAEFVSKPNNSKIRRFQSIYKRLRLLSIPLTMIMAALVALSVIRAARIMIFEAYKNSAEFGMRTLKNELSLRKDKQWKMCLDQARNRSKHERNFLILKNGKTLVSSGNITDFEKYEKKAKLFLKGDNDCKIEITGIGPFIKLFGALKMDNDHILVMTEGAGFITSLYLCSGAIIIAIILVGSSLITYLFSRGLFKPMMARLEEIRQALYRYGKGESNIRLKINEKNQDEFDLVCNEFNKMADTIETLKEELIERIQSERRLLSTLAHDINTPVTVLRGHAENLIEHGRELSKDQLDSITTGLLSQAIYIQSLVDDLLTMANSKVSRLKLVPELFELDPVLDQVVNVFEPLASQMNISIIADAQGLKIYADKIRLAQILNNLVMNALRHAKGATLIEIIGEKQGEGVLLSVCDDGCGIESVSDEKRDNLVRSAKIGKSYGLGLTIVEMLAKMHGGWFSYKDNPFGKGACFQVWFPDKGKTFKGE